MLKCTYTLFLTSRWEVEDWQPCSQSCGGGFKTRAIKCIIDRDGGKADDRIEM